MENFGNMFRSLKAYLETCRRVVLPRPTKKKESQSPDPLLQDKILEACSEKDVSKLQALLDEWHRKLFIQAAKSGNVELLQSLLDRYSATAPQYQLMLEEAASAGNSEVFRFILDKRPETVINDEIRHKALQGGVEIWKVIYDHRPELIEYDFGHLGNLVVMATIYNDAATLRFCLEAGLDPNRSCYWTTPIIELVPRWRSIKPEMMNLLVEYGATREKSLEALQEWHDTKSVRERLLALQGIK